MTNPYVELNKFKLNDLRRKINNCIQNDQKFTLWIFDIDDTLNKSNEACEEQISKICYKASEEYRAKLSKILHMQDDIKYSEAKSWDLKNQVLEDYGKYNGAIDYSLIHNENNLYPNSIETINYMLNNHDENTFIILCTQRNPIREEEYKIEKYYGYTKYNLDGIVCLPVFEEAYYPGARRDMTSKEIYIMSDLGIPIQYLSSCILIDDSPRIRRRFKEKGGIVIPAYMKGYYEELEDDDEDRLRVLTSFSPSAISLIYNKIKYDYNIYDETKNFKKVLKR